MQVTYDTAMDKVYQDEGGYTNDAADPGGPTIYGITIHDARMYWKSDATAADMRTMPKSVAKEIYAKHYATPINYDGLPAGFDYSVLDYGINSGIGRALPLAQRLTKSGGKSALAIAEAARAYPDKQGLIKAYWNARAAFLHQLRTFSVFGKGWMRRVTTGEALAMKLYLKFGAQFSEADTKIVLKGNANAATKKAKDKVTQGTVTAGGAAGGGAASQSHQFDFTNNKVLWIVAGIAVVLLLANLGWWAYVYFMRAKAYTEAAK